MNTGTTLGENEKTRYFRSFLKVQKTLIRPRRFHLIEVEFFAARERWLAVRDFFHSLIVIRTRCACVLERSGPPLEHDEYEDPHDRDGEH